ncbi:MAG TPA: DUF1330 domain-containing protein [Stellaceae bacterium]|nr:DUF1330 domain-containing protein [Stellaceae bacterium]
MPAFVVGDLRITDLAKFTAMVPEFLASIARGGGRVVLSGGNNMEVFDGGPMPERVVVIQFPDADAARNWYQSPDNQALLPTRMAATQGCLYMIDGARPVG